VIKWPEFCSAQIRVELNFGSIDIIEDWKSCVLDAGHKGDHLTVVDKHRFNWHNVENRNEQGE
jgi:hypothetical protein